MSEIINETPETTDVTVDSPSAAKQIAMSFLVSTASSVGCVVGLTAVSYVSTRIAQRRAASKASKTIENTETPTES